VYIWVLSNFIGRVAEILLKIVWKYSSRALCVVLVGLSTHRLCVA
jgi:hypothetical protein